MLRESHHAPPSPPLAVPLARCGECSVLLPGAPLPPGSRAVLNCPACARRAADQSRAKRGPAKPTRYPVSHGLHRFHWDMWYDEIG